MPTYQAFGLVVDADRRIPPLEGTKVPDARVADLSIVLLPPDAAGDAPSGASSTFSAASDASTGDDWYESVPDDAGDVLRVTRSTAGAYRFAYSDGAEFHISADGCSIEARWPSGLSVDDAAVYLLGPVMAFVLRMRGIVCLHASAIAAADGCFAILVPGGHGKSTTAAACAKRGLGVLTDDVLAIEHRDGEFRVLPAYPIIRLWSEAVEGLFGAADSLPRITPDHETWDKRYLDLTAPGYTFQRTALPLRAIYTHLRQESDVPSFEPLPLSASLVTLIGNVYSLTRPEPEQRAREFAFLDRLAKEIPMKRYRGLHGLEHLDEQCRLLHTDCLETAAAAGAVR